MLLIALKERRIMKEIKEIKEIKKIVNCNNKLNTFS